VEAGHARKGIHDIVHSLHDIGKHDVQRRFGKFRSLLRANLAGLRRSTNRGPNGGGEELQGEDVGVFARIVIVVFALRVQSEADGIIQL
jgi:hypothetical protein